MPSRSTSTVVRSVSQPTLRTTWASPPTIFDPCGKINGAASEAGDHHNRTYADHLGSLGEDHSLLDAVQMRDLTGTDHYQSGLYTPGTVMLQPSRAMCAACPALLGGNVHVFENSPVRSFTRSGAGWTVECDRAAVSHAPDHPRGEWPRRELRFLFRPVAARLYLRFHEPAIRPGAIGRERSVGHHARRSYGSHAPPDFDHRRNTHRRTHAIYLQSGRCRVGAGQIEAAGRLHDSGFRARFPRLEGVEMEYRWAGHLCLSRNGVTAFGEIDEGVYSACCQNGLGLARGTLSGMAAADLAAGVDSVEARSLLDQEAPSRLPPAPVTWLGANAVMRWKEWRAGREC